ncbi:helix-turn-helix domain-containing protein [Rugamonas sp. FT107W]|uniref:Helix-turn-helix domain-containing protein n=1 Tax=Duganella vulcania TaxID=2692166 RepID=A0A845HBB4_9BURK|nr:GAF domain-containing protein [Duganella vulcania]MYN16402.1 helix-turn-helix domain-containing protein [Duganella vulcania]
MKTRPSIHDQPEGDSVLTTRAAARLLGVAVSTAQLWMESGAIHSWKTPGGHRRCRLSEIERLIRQRGVDEPAPFKPAASAPLPAEFLMPEAPAYPTLACEPERLAALAASGLIDSEADASFDRITWLATQITQCPMALVSLLTSRRQWFKSRIGVDAPETPRDWAFCSYAILREEGLVVHDARLDERFRDNPLVTGPPFIRFYAGVPVLDAALNRLGTLCVLDSQPRRLSEEQSRGLMELARMVSERIARGG